MCWLIFTICNGGIVKLGLISTHLKLFLGQMGGKEIYFWGKKWKEYIVAGNAPIPLSDAATASNQRFIQAQIKSNRIKLL